MRTKTFYIGTDGEQTVNSHKTNEQIKAVIALDCAFEHDGEKVTWNDLNNQEEPRTIFQSIMRDRYLRVDNHTLMADRPAFVVITAIDNKAVRMEYYEGHDALSLVYDLRSKELQGKKLSNFMDEDSQAYDPAKFLKDAFGIPEELSKPILDETHKRGKV
jgi:hypothetical protein